MEYVWKNTLITLLEYKYFFKNFLKATMAIVLFSLGCLFQMNINIVTNLFLFKTLFSNAERFDNVRISDIIAFIFPYFLPLCIFKSCRKLNCLE